MPSPAGTLRTIDISSPSSRDETIHVLRALFLIAFFATLVVAVQRGARAAEPTAAQDAKAFPFVRRFADLPAVDQRVFTSLREGIGEAERRRSSTGKWPDVETLAADGIPPFAPDPIDRDGLVWAMRSEKQVVNYVGAPRDGAKRTTFVVVLTEPDGSGPAVPSETPADEVHHRLDNGMLLHVAVFVGDGLPPPAGVAPTMSFSDGWLQALAGSPRVLAR